MPFRKKGELKSKKVSELTSSIQNTGEKKNKSNDTMRQQKQNVEHSTTR